ncbi:unnamed protein product [Sphagnum jensenii]|uniref:DNA-directed RNA polymerase n=1 Tax=Sphagnum jensenii TaxID=128206 RepID=A0ABP0VHV5_9BRYO
MVETFDLRTIPLVQEGSLALSRRLFDHRNTVFAVALNDGVIEITGRRLMVNIFVWRPLVKRNMTVEKRHSLLNGLFTAQALADVQTEIYNDVVERQKAIHALLPFEEERSILWDLTETYEDLHQMVIRQLGSYHLSISAFELCDIIAHPSIDSIRRIDVTREMELSIAAAEKKISEHGKIVIDAIHQLDHPSNVLKPFLDLGVVNKQQLSGLVATIGYRVDASDTMIRRPILTSYMDGLQDIREVAIDSMTAKKTIYSNKIAMPDSQYHNRMHQLLASAIRKLYPGDCGSNVTVPFYIHQRNAKNLYGKNIVVDGSLVTLKKDNIHPYIDTTVQLRSPLTCRHRDGICHVCGGKITEFLPQGVLVGIQCAVEFLSAASQLVLKMKHTDSTRSVTFKLHEQLNDFLMIHNNDIYIRPNLDLSEVKIGVRLRDVPHINELQRQDDEGEDHSAISEQEFSSINYIMFADVKTDTPLTGEVPMTFDGMNPYFSVEMLNYMRDNFRHISVDDTIWIPLKRFNNDIDPIMRCVVQSSSMIRYNKELERFATSEIKKHDSLTTCLAAYSDLVFREVSTNLMHVEVVLRSYLITSETDYRVPIVTDINNVRFSDIHTIIARRSIGEQLAFERLPDYLSNPITFITEHQKGPFDLFFFPPDE